MPNLEAVRVTTNYLRLIVIINPVERRRILSISTKIKQKISLKGRFFQAGGNGFEPLLIDPESIVLPLDEPPIFNF
jgi:hypothetical protein